MGSFLYWGDAEDDQIRRLGGQISTRQLARLLHRSEDAVRSRAKRLGVSLRSGGNGCPWTPEEDAVLKKHCKMKTFVELGEMLGRTAKSCEYRARNLGLLHAPKKKYHPPKRKADGKRRCHDCGRPTTDYRCAECWRKLRAAQNYSFEDEEIE